MKERGESCFPGLPLGPSPGNFLDSEKKKKRTVGTRKWRHSARGRGGEGREEGGGGPAGRPPGRPPDAVNNSHRRTEDSLQARGIGPGRKSSDVWRGLVVFPVCEPRILVALTARKAQSQVPLPALREGAPRNCPGGATCLPGSHLRPAVPMATDWPGPGFTA